MNLSSSWYSGDKNLAAGDSGFGPALKKKHSPGVLFKYGPNSIQVAFTTWDYKRQVNFIGGLTKGFMATEYLEPLAVALEKERWSLVQTLLSSSYSGYGSSTLDQDAVELDQLISHLINKEDSEGVVLLGTVRVVRLIRIFFTLLILCHHLNFSIAIVHYMRRNSACSKAVRAAILEAPVSSDCEYRATLPETAAMMDLASKMISEGKGLEFMPREANPDSPITAYRYHSLSESMGDDDMFSSHLSDEQLRGRLGHMPNTPCQVVYSTEDEYVDKKAQIQRLCRAMGGAEKVEIKRGKSNRVGGGVEAIMDFLKRGEVPKGWDDPWS